VLGDRGFTEYRMMARFVHETANILELVQDTLAPRSFDRFLENQLKQWLIKGCGAQRPNR
jgi:hypothetical protein